MRVADGALFTYEGAGFRLLPLVNARLRLPSVLHMKSADPELAPTRA